MSSGNVTELNQSLDSYIRAFLPRVMQTLERWQENECSKERANESARECCLWDDVVRAHVMRSVTIGETEMRQAIQAADGIIAARRATICQK